MKKIKDKEPILQEILTFLKKNEYMNYFRLKAYAYNKNKHKWLALLDDSANARITIHQYAENRRKELGLPFFHDDRKSVYACKDAEKAYTARKLNKLIKNII